MIWSVIFGGLGSGFTLYLYLRDNSGVLKVGSGYAGQGLECCLTDKRKGRNLVGVEATKLNPFSPMNREATRRHRI